MKGTYLPLRALIYKDLLKNYAVPYDITIVSIIGMNISIL